MEVTSYNSALGYAQSAYNTSYDQMNKLINEERAWSAAQAQKQMDYQTYMSNTAHQREMADLRAAGLNPVLAANNGASSPTGAMAESGSIASAIPQLLDVMNTTAKSIHDASLNTYKAFQQEMEQNRRYELDVKKHVDDMAYKSHEQEIDWQKFLYDKEYRNKQLDIEWQKHLSDSDYKSKNLEWLKEKFEKELEVKANQISGSMKNGTSKKSGSAAVQATQEAVLETLTDLGLSQDQIQEIVPDNSASNLDNWIQDIKDLVNGMTFNTPVGKIQGSDVVELVESTAALLNENFNLNMERGISPDTGEGTVSEKKIQRAKNNIKKVKNAAKRQYDWMHNNDYGAILTY